LEIKYFIGIKIDRKERKLELSQSAYIKNILLKFNMKQCNSVNSPLPSKLNFELLDSDKKEVYLCQSLVGCLMYVMLCTRPDLSISVNLLSRYSQKNN